MTTVSSDRGGTDSTPNSSASFPFIGCLGCAPSLLVLARLSGLDTASDDVRLSGGCTPGLLVRLASAETLSLCLFALISSKDDTLSLRPSCCNIPLLELFGGLSPLADAATAAASTPRYTTVAPGNSPPVFPRAKLNSPADGGVVPGKIRADEASWKTALWFDLRKTTLSLSWASSVPIESAVWTSSG